MERDGGAIRGDRLVRPAGLREDVAEVGVGRRVIGLEGDGRAVGGDGVIGAVGVAQGVGEVEEDGGLPRAQEEGTLVAGDGVRQMALLGKDDTQVVVGVGEVGVEGDGPACGGRRIVELVQAAQDFGEAGVQDGKVRRQGDGLAKEIRREIVAAELREQEAELVESFEVGGVLGEDLLVDGGGFGEAPGAVTLHGELDVRGGCGGCGWFLRHGEIIGESGREETIRTFKENGRVKSRGGRTRVTAGGRLTGWRRRRGAGRGAPMRRGGF